MLVFCLLIFTVLLSLSTSTLLINYSAPSPISTLGQCQLEGSSHGDHIACPGNSSIYIKTGTDIDGKPALHYHRDPTFRRPEVNETWAYAENKHYYVGYEFRMRNVQEGLAVFQWKDGKGEMDSAKYQDVPFGFTFTEVLPTRLFAGSNPPGGEPAVLWSDSFDFSNTTSHNVTLTWDTMSGGNSKLEVWLNGTMMLEKDGLTFWTGECYSKFGIYIVEKEDHDMVGGSNVSDNFVYGAQVSDANLAECGGLGGKNRIRR